jgi:hypothetical protein
MPETAALLPIANLFKPLLAFRGQLSLAANAKALWNDFQLGNRARMAEVPDNRQDLSYALASEPTHVLKVAAIFELAIATLKGTKQITKIGADALQCAIEHVAENLRASAYLFRRAQQLEAQQQGEEILVKIRSQFPTSCKYPDTIFASRTTLTSTFCHHTTRRGAISTEELYLHILPELIRQGQAQLALKKGKFELYAFRASDFQADPPPSGSPKNTRPKGANSTVSTNSTSSHAQTIDTLHAHICTGIDNIVDAAGVVGNVETVENTPPASAAPQGGVDVFTAGALALDLETCAEPKVARRGQPPKITTTREALHPWKGEIRLLTLGDEQGNIGSFDLRADPLPAEIRSAIERCPWIAHNAGFDSLFLAVHLGIVAREVFCTLTASRLWTRPEV